MKPKPFSEITDFEPAAIEVEENTYIKGIFTISRVDPNTLPDGLHKYDIREGDVPYATVEPYVGSDHMGAFITQEEIPMMIVNEHDQYSDIISFGVLCEQSYENDWRKPYLKD